MTEKFAAAFLWLRGRKVLVVLSLLLISFFLLSLVTQLSQKRQLPLASPRSPSPTPNATLPSTLPSVSFSTYENKAPLPTVPNQVNGYTLKTNYSVDEAKELGKKLGLTETKIPDDRFVIFYNMTDMNSRGILTFDKVTGGISFQSYGVYRPSNLPLPTSSSNLSPPTSNFNPTTIASSFLTDLNLSDPTISCPITYQRKGLTGVTFVECHRDWSLVGLPILNTIGVLNIPEEKSLSDVRLGTVDASSPSDPSITSVSLSPQAEGKARPNDFNTITVGITEDGRIFSLESNMRRIVETKQYVPSDLLTPEEALNQFISHKAQFSLTIPAGSGSVDWNKVYPNNQASGKKATITDYLLTFLENPGQAPQERLTPMYLIRGTAELSSGYTVRFMETVPALKSGLSFFPTNPTSNGGPERLALSLSNGSRRDSSEVNSRGDVAGDQTTLVVQNSDDRSLKFGSFDPSLTITPAPSHPPSLPPLTSTPQLSSPPPPPSICTAVDSSQGSPQWTVDVPGLGTMTVTYGTGGSMRGLGNPRAFFFQSADFPVTSIAEVRRLFFEGTSTEGGPVAQQYAINVARYMAKNQIYVNPTSAVQADQIYPIYGQINNSSSNLCAHANVAPAPGCQGQDPITDVYNINQINAVANKVTTYLISTIQNGTIPQLAQKTDVLPAATIDAGLSQLFYDHEVVHGNSCYISTGSPSLYFYPEKETEVSVSLGGPISYSYPSFTSNPPSPSWSILAKPDGSLQSSVFSRQSTDNRQLTTHNRLYYEYDKSQVSFTQHNEGFVVKSNEWEGFIRDTLSPQLGLTQAEEDDLVVDIRNALSNPSSPPNPSIPSGPYLQLSLVSREELDEKLPLTISPQPNTFHRIHLLLTPLAEYTQLSTPLLTRLDREGFTTLELGASTQ